MSALDYVIIRSTVDGNTQSEAVAELGALRAQAAQAEALAQRVMVLEMVVNEARRLIDICAAREIEGYTQNPHMVSRLRAWLAAHAQPEQEQAG